MPTYGVALHGEYNSLGKEIERIAIATGHTKSYVIREALCAHFGYKPAMQMRPYSKKYV
ncbi:hypothetical protein [Methanosarcina sp.]|uniref:hypothetical protein n=1 Tax=Methanosarcina sp. TaxID=2213 RepID=UPI003BB5DF3C